MSISNEPINAEPSMDEILSSIRRILKDDEAVPMPAGGERGASGDTVMMLDASMMVPEPAPAGPVRHEAGELPPPAAISSASTLSSAMPPGTATDAPYEPDAPQKQPVHPDRSTIEGPQPLLGAQAAEAAASHIGALVRTVSADRNLAVSRGGISIEEIVREEIRPMLKSWLDAHLPGLVERIVRAEIERLVGQPGGH
jgi:cell pole-organizing protein PopZ